VVVLEVDCLVLVVDSLVLWEEVEIVENPSFFLRKMRKEACLLKGRLKIIYLWFRSRSFFCRNELMQRKTKKTLQ
jgi:hypothetical protein